MQLMHEEPPIGPRANFNWTARSYNPTREYRSTEVGALWDKVFEAASIDYASKIELLPTRIELIESLIKARESRKSIQLSPHLTVDLELATKYAWLKRPGTEEKIPIIGSGVSDAVQSFVNHAERDYHHVEAIDRLIDYWLNTGVHVKEFPVLLNHSGHLESVGQDRFLVLKDNGYSKGDPFIKILIAKQNDKRFDNVEELLWMIKKAILGELVASFNRDLQRKLHEPLQ